jgi:transcriptional regulator with XRE-family HTH domain
MPDVDPLDEPDDLEPYGRGTGQRSPQPPVELDRRIGEALRQLLSDRNLSYRKFADVAKKSDPRENWDKNRIGDLINAVRRSNVVELLDVLATLGVDPEWFFRTVGILPPDVDTESRIRVDPILNRPTRDAMLALYDTAKRARAS